jgi:dihydrofolate reductase
MMQSLDGYIAGPTGLPKVFAPGPKLSRHFLDHVSGLAGMVYGTRIYEVMRNWDTDQPEWDEGNHEFAAAWRPKPKWVASRSLQAVGANATRVSGDLEAFARRLADVDGEIDVAGAELAGSLSALGLIDWYRLYFRAVPAESRRKAPWASSSTAPTVAQKYPALKGVVPNNASSTAEIRLAASGGAS